MCLACHQEIPAESAAISLLHHVAERIDAIPKNNQEHTNLIHKSILLAAWVKAGGMTLGPLFVTGVAWLGWRRFRKRRRGGPGPAHCS